MGGKGSGGKRKNSGRKTTSIKKTMVSIRLSKNITDWLNKQPVGQRTKLIENAIIKTYF